MWLLAYTPRSLLLAFFIAAADLTNPGTKPSIDARYLSVTSDHVYILDPNFSNEANIPPSAQFLQIVRGPAMTDGKGRAVIQFHAAFYEAGSCAVMFSGGRSLENDEAPAARAAADALDAERKLLAQQADQIYRLAPLTAAFHRPCHRDPARYPLPR